MLLLCLINLGEKVKYMINISKANINDINRLKWFYNNYNKKNIPTLLTYKMQLCNKFSLSNMQIYDMNNYLKAIRQDMEKIFLSVQNIDSIYSLYKNQEKKNLSENERETIAIYIEYIITKYRVIIEYMLKILDMIVKYSDKKVKKNRKKISSNERYNMKLDYLKSLIDDERRTILNNKWFQSIRKTRNSIIHNGATCLVFGESKEKLFQIYNLEVEELITDNFYLYSGNCVHFDYFISLNLAYLTYFIDTIFSVICTKVGYDEKIDPIMESILNPMPNTVDNKQLSIMRWVKNIIIAYEDCY